MFLLLSNFALVYLPLSRKTAHALENVALLDHCLILGCRLFLSKTHLFPLPLQLWVLDFKTVVSPHCVPCPKPPQWNCRPVIHRGLLFFLHAIKTFCRLWEINVLFTVICGSY